MSVIKLILFLLFSNKIGPVTVPMVSQSGSPPIPMPVQVPPGHVMQQIVDENGTLRHVILSTAQHQQIHSQGSVQGVQPHIHGHYVSLFIHEISFVFPIPDIICFSISCAYLFILLLKSVKNNNNKQ